MSKCLIDVVSTCFLDHRAPHHFLDQCKSLRRRVDHIFIILSILYWGTMIFGTNNVYFLIKKNDTWFFGS